MGRKVGGGVQDGEHMKKKFLRQLFEQFQIHNNRDFHLELTHKYPSPLNILHQSGTFVAANEPLLTHHHNLKSIIYNLFLMQYILWVWTKFNDIYLPLWASLVAQMIKNPPAVWETWVQFLVLGMATHPSILAWRIPMDRGHVAYGPWNHKESERTEQQSTAHLPLQYHKKYFHCPKNPLFCNPLVHPLATMYLLTVSSVLLFFQNIM